MLKLQFPRNALEAASWEPSLAYETARATAVETTLSGLMWTFSPMVDTARDRAGDATWKVLERIRCQRCIFKMEHPRG